MSFDILEFRLRRFSRDVRSGRRSVDLLIKEEEEGEDLMRIYVLLYCCFILL